MAFPVSFLDLDDIGRKLRMPLANGAVIEDTLTALHARHDHNGDLSVYVETPTRSSGSILHSGLGTKLDPHGQVEYLDEVARVWV